MARTVLVSSCSVSRRAVHKLLCGQHSVLTVACKQIILDKLEKLVLVSVGTLDGSVYVFDIKRCPDIVMSGDLWRVLQSTEITKVMHDCRYTSAALKAQFGVTLNNVFDTQAAYCVVMMLRSLPPRFIHPHHLYEKFGDVVQKYDDDIQVSVSGCGIFWAQRPLSDAMIHSAATDVRLLLPVYNNLRGELCPDHEDVLADLCLAYIHGRFPRQSRQKYEKSPHSSRSAPILRLTESQSYLLENTLPQSAAALTYRK